MRKDEIVRRSQGDNKRINPIDFLKLKHSTKGCHSSMQMTHKNECINYTYLLQLQCRIQPTIAYQYNSDNLRMLSYGKAYIF